MKKPQLVRFVYEFSSDLLVAQAYSVARRLSVARGIHDLPTSYRIKKLYVKVHPEDVPALRDACRALEDPSEQEAVNAAHNARLDSRVK